MLGDFLDGAMSPEDEAHLKEHLEGCPPCVDFLRTYRATPELCRRALASQMPAEMSNRLMEFLRGKLAKPAP